MIENQIALLAKNKCLYNSLIVCYLGVYKASIMIQTETPKVSAFKIAISVVLLNCLVLLTYLIQ